LRNGGTAARIAVIPGDGIGKEVMPEAVKVLRAVAASAKRPMEFIEFDWGADKFLREGVTLPAGAVELLRDEFDAILFGALGDPRVPRISTPPISCWGCASNWISTSTPGPSNCSMTG